MQLKIYLAMLVIIYIIILAACEISKQNVCNEDSYYIKSPTLSEKKSCVACFLGDLCNVRKDWPKRKNPDSCLYIHYICFLSLTLLLLLTSLLLVVLSLFCKVCQIYFSLVDLDKYICILDVYCRLMIMN